MGVGCSPNAIGAEVLRNFGVTMSDDMYADALALSVLAGTSLPRVFRREGWVSDLAAAYQTEYLITVGAL